MTLVCLLHPRHAIPLLAYDTKTSSFSEEEFFSDIPIVLTATRLSQPVSDAPASMTIIDRQMIKASGARDIVDVFKLVPGFQVQHEVGHILDYAIYHTGEGKLNGVGIPPEWNDAIQLLTAISKFEKGSVDIGCMTFTWDEVGD